MANLTRRTPNRTLRNLQREVDSLFDRFFNRTGDERSSAVWAPQTDLVETDEDVQLRLDVPGMSKEDIDINLQNGTLTVSGERTSERTDEGEDYVRVERAFGNFHRTFTLPDAVDHENIEATYEDGVLSINVPKTEESTRRQIEIQ
jgi:HSP20 family protein